MGTANIEVSVDLRDRLTQPPLNARVRIMGDSRFEDARFHADGSESPATRMLLVWSERLPLGYNGQMEIVIDGDDVRFKRWADLG